MSGNNFCDAVIIDGCFSCKPLEKSGLSHFPDQISGPGFKSSQHNTLLIF